MFVYDVTELEVKSADEAYNVFWKGTVIAYLFVSFLVFSFFFCKKMLSSFIKLFKAKVPFLYALKALENQKFFRYFQGYRNGTLT